MLVRFARKHWQGLAIVLIAILIALLAGLEVIWSGERRQAQAAIMQDALESSMQQMEQELERELISLLAMFQIDGRPTRSEVWNRLAERYELWLQTSVYSCLVRCVLVQESDAEGQKILHYLPPGEEQPIPAQWEGELALLKPRLEGPVQIRTRGLRTPPWTLFAEAGAIVQPLPGVRRSPRSERPGLLEYLILLLDWRYVVETVLPDYVQRHFSGPEGNQRYQLAVAVAGSQRILYRSDDSIDHDWIAEADGVRTLRFLPAARAVPLGQGRRGDPRLRPAREGREALGLPPGLLPASQAASPTQAIGRGRLAIDSEQVPPTLVLAASHVSGSLEGVASLQRWRNLSAALGMLLLLGSAVVLVVVSARRAARLAAMRMDFIVSITHELRTPLSVIRSVGENLADGVVSGKDHVKRYGELVRDQGRRLSDMVEQTLQLAGLESGKRSLRLEKLDPSAAVQTALDQAQPMIEQAEFTLQRDDQHQLPSVNADQMAVQQILANLLSNAVKYGEPGRWVGVETELVHNGSKPEVQIRVRDQGVGIPANEAGHIFDAFYRGSALRNGNVQGSGLGLKLARDMAKGMGARLSFTSEPGQGTEFVLHLPVHSDTAPWG